MVRINLNASYHAILDQSKIETNPENRNHLLEAIRGYYERRQLEVKTYKFAGSILYEANLENRRKTLDKSRLYFGKARVIDKEVFNAICDREIEEAIK